MPRDDLERSLERAMSALGSESQGAELAPIAGPQGRRVLGYVGSGLGLGGALFAGLAVATTPWLLIPAAALGLGSAVVFGVRAVVPHFKPKPADPSKATIGIGAEVDESVRLEPGAVVEMGATVRAGCVIRTGAVVRMGATVGPNVVLEPRAVVGWGATIREGATIGEGASIGAGATVQRGAVVSAGTHVFAGATVHASTKAGAPRPEKQLAVPAAARAPEDARASRIDSLCDALERELNASSEHVRAFLGAPEKTVGTLRRTCHDILQRELGLRRAADPEALTRLEAERTSLEARIASSDDEAIRRSLRGAVEAIDEQVRQRSLLRRNADRLDAELTRLLFTIEGLTSQVLRLKSEGTAAPTTDLEQSVTRLRDELDALADAVEAVSRDERDAMLSPVTPVSSEPDSQPLATRPREKS